MMAPWLPGSCGTITQMAWGRRAARSVHRLSMARWPYRASGAISVSTTGLVPSGAPETAVVDRVLDGGQAALDQRREPGRVPAARRGGVRGLDQVPRQADLGGLRPHGVDQHPGHVDDRRAEPAGQRLDGAVGAVGVHAEGQERPGRRAFGQPVPGPPAVDQLRDLRAR